MLNSQLQIFALHICDLRCKPTMRTELWIQILSIISPLLSVSHLTELIFFAILGSRIDLLQAYIYSENKPSRSQSWLAEGKEYILLGLYINLSPGFILIPHCGIKRKKYLEGNIFKSIIEFEH